MDFSFADEATQIAEMIDRALRRVNTCLPGKVIAFRAGPPAVVDVQPSIQMQTHLNGVQGFRDLPLVVNVPLVLPFSPGAGFGITMPISAGGPSAVDLLAAAYRPMVQLRRCSGTRGRDRRMPTSSFVRCYSLSWSISYTRGFCELVYDRY